MKPGMLTLRQLFHGVGSPIKEAVANGTCKIVFSPQDVLLLALKTLEKSKYSRGRGRCLMIDGKIV